MLFIPDYRIKSKIFESNRTEVYRANKIKSDEAVIIKVLKNNEPEEISEFRTEYNILSILSNVPGVSKAYQLTKYKNYNFIITEDIFGESLKSIIQSKELGIDDILSIAINVITIIGNIHAKNIIHKDINSSNIIFNQKTKQINIIDFGISTKLSIENPCLKNPNILEGTLKYISPEQTGRMNRALDYRTDYYSFGVTLFEMLTKKLPFDKSDPMELVHCHIAKTPVEPHILDSKIPVAISKIVMKLLSKNAEDRYQSTAGIIADLNNCLNQLQSTGKIIEFATGQNDIPEKFQIPQKLYGRESEIKQLLNSFERASYGQAELMMVSGYSGIGKTALIKEIYKPVTALKGYFISGKFDQFQRNVPYKAIVDAFSELLKQILTETTDELNTWKEKILGALGPNARIIIEIIPELELIIGKQPDLDVLPPIEAKNRFNYTFQNFIQIFTKKEHPLVIFIDDLQWADDASLKLIHMIITDKDNALLIIGAYRNNEVEKSHPLLRVLEEIKNEDVTINNLLLGPLKFQHIKKLISETLYCSDDDAKPLAELVLAKTAGNPFFINEFLKTLYAKELIKYNKEYSNQKKNNSGWDWDISKIRNQGITDNVVELMTEKIKELKIDTQKTLSYSACIGNIFDLKTLTIVNEKSWKKTADELMEALSAGLLICLSSFNDITNSSEESVKECPDVIFKFTHDRIQQAAYSLIKKSNINKLHYQVGKLILKNTPDSKKGEKFFDIVNHLNSGIEIVTSQSEKYEIAKLNLEAGRKAKTSAAYEPAFEYFNTGLKLLCDENWKDQYELTLSLHVETAESAYLIGKFDKMESLCDPVIAKASTIIDKAKIYEVKILAYSAQNKPFKAVKTAIHALKLMDIDIPEKANKLNIIISLLKTKLCISAKKIKNLNDLSIMTDSKMLAANRILSKVTASAYFCAPELYSLIVLQRIRLSVRYGNSAESSSAYGSYGIVLSGVLGDTESGYFFGKYAFQIINFFKAKEFEGRIIFVFNTFLRHWKEHLKHSLKPLESGIVIAQEAGDLEYASNSAFVFFHFSIISGTQLSAIKEKCIAYKKTVERLNQKMQLYRYQQCFKAVINLQDKIEKPWLFTGKIYDENEMIPIHEEANDQSSLACLYCLKSLICVIFRESDYGLECSDLQYKYLDGVKSSYIVPLYYFNNSLLQLSIFLSSRKSKQKNILKKVEANQKKIKKWAKNAPMNFLNKYYLVEAEKQKILGKDSKAIDYYDKAIKMSSENEFIHEEAIAAELCGIFWLEKGNQDVASAYIKRSYQAYKLWGANNKLKDLEKKYPKLLGINIINENFSDQTVLHKKTSTKSGTSFLDLNTVFKSSQAISREIVLNNLLKKLMDIVMENAGAEKGFLILEQDKKLFVASQSYTDNVSTQDISAQSQDYILLDQFELISKTIVQYVVRSLENVVLNDALNEGMFTMDQYITNNKTKSVLCLPIIHHGSLTGVIYLENNKTTSAFTNDRVEMINLLTSQAAISIQNAKLYMDMKVAEEKYRGIFENSVEGIFRSTPDGKFIDANPSMARILGFNSPKEMIEAGTNAATQCYADPDDRNRFINEILTHGKVVREEGQYMRQDGSKGWATISARAIRDKNDNIVFYEGTLNDITERKQKEQAERKKEIVEAINEKIMESIRYAKMIQESLLPEKKEIAKLVPKSFFLYKPKDVVGGDIYFIDEINQGFILAVIDCTGHGVPGAFMTMIACSALKRIVKDEKIHDPAQILKKLNFAVKTTLHQDTDHAMSDDGMDAGICVVNKKNNQLIFAGAKLPLLYYYENEIHFIKGDKQSIGYKKSKRSNIDFSFKNHNLEIKKEMSFYLATDGYQDQMGGEKNKRFGKNRLTKLLLEIKKLPFESQKQKLIDVFNNFKGNNEVQDDHTIVGFEI